MVFKSKDPLFLFLECCFLKAEDVVWFWFFLVKQSSVAFIDFVLCTVYEQVRASIQAYIQACIQACVIHELHPNYTVTTRRPGLVGDTVCFNQDGLMGYTILY